MPLYRKCSKCKKKVPIGTLCECEKKVRRESYKAYKKRRMSDKQEAERQRFYNTNAWKFLSDTVKKHYLGMCVMCWYRNNEMVNSEYTHHIITLKEDMNMSLNKGNCIPLCDSCHKRVHIEYDKGKDYRIKMQNILRTIIYEFNQTFKRK
ncbi:HNH endonuclease [Clostridium felsineum]|uniref:HNH endonuclease n=1 Tax=Clostridium felsineum TaxID=36839 RepID=UPI0009C8E4AE|nr:HNH endonuclease [Clostridium felsineum]URZ15322.1 hypothetical protein CLFE_013400 [Clostridium felsineum DSM 794]